MKQFLTPNMIDYVWFHFGLLYNIYDLKNKFNYTGNQKTLKINNGIYFNLSDNEFEISKVIFIDDIPILFATAELKPFYTLTDKGLVFHHDILKSAFYLLSGYQELCACDRDAYDRYKYTSSVQYTFNFVQKPIVNYYFKILFEALCSYCSLNNLPLPIFKKPFSPFCINLTHDVDKIDKYTYYNILGKVKNTMGLIPSNFNFKERFNDLTHFVINKFKSKFDPHWSFNFLLDIEADNNIQATYFFLDKVHKRDASYKFHEPRIVNLIKTIHDEGHEVAMHGTYGSYNDSNIFKRSLIKLNGITAERVSGTRQHYLRYKLPETAIIHDDSAMIYDSSLGFAEHEGFRNSFCLPFKLYNFDKDRAFNTWQIPLNVMDNTLFDYRKLSYEKAHENIFKILNEIDNFGGVFTLLWHNNYLDDLEMPGIRSFYRSIIEKIAAHKAVAISCKEIIFRIKESQIN